MVLCVKLNLLFLVVAQFVLQLFLTGNMAIKNVLAAQLHNNVYRSKFVYLFASISFSIMACIFLSHCLLLGFSSMPTWPTGILVSLIVLLTPSAENLTIIQKIQPQRHCQYSECCNRLRENFVC
jgi:O-antigen ligase